MKSSLLASVLGLLILCSTSWAEVRLPRLFADNMVLQQQTNNAVWGWAQPGERITVTASWGATVATKADKNGRWKLFLATPGHGMKHSLVIVGENTIRIQNVAIGEVWLCAGQSNMGWATGNSFEAEQEATVDLPNFRIFKSQREHWHKPLEEARDRLQQWKPCNAKSAAETSAVSYYFGKLLHQRLDVPVGIIVQAYAGTPIEGWLPWELQQDDPRAVAHKKLLDQNARRLIARGETVAKSLATYEQEFKLYTAKIDAGETMKNAFRPLQPPFITKPASLGHQYPAHIFNAMIYPLRPYGIRGMIWYQGERNSKNVPQAIHYRRQLAQLIRYYRSSWHAQSAGNVRDDFPFQFTQLPSWNPPQVKPVEGLEASWAANREAMRQVQRDVPNVGLVVSIDTGDSIALHPKNKKPIGIRHALLALQQTYGKEIVGQGPRYTGHRIDDGKVVLEFNATGSGLMAASPGPLNAFAIAGKDRQWHWADAQIKGKTVVVASDKVATPIAVRYAWAMNPSRRNLLYNKEGLPASPFRTDSWPLFKAGDEIVDVNKPAKPDGYKPVDWKRPRMPQATSTGQDALGVKQNSQNAPENQPNGPKQKTSKALVKKLAKELGAATIAGDYVKIADYTHSAVIKQIGGRQKMIELTMSSMKQLKDRGISFSKYEAGDPGEFHAAGKDLFVVVPILVELKFPAGKIRDQSYLLGISSDDGKSWAFMDGSGLQDKDFRAEVLPKMPATLELPVKGKPEIIKED